MRADLTRTRYDAVIIGAGHNGLIAACYLAMAGRSVLILEKNDEIGGATRSKHVFPGIDARVSVYSYLISLLPQKILDDLGLQFTTRRRAVASFTPFHQNGAQRGLLIHNQSEEVTRQSFEAAFGDDRAYRSFRKFEESISLFARKVWPTLLKPLPAKDSLRKLFVTRDEQRIWDHLVENPLANLIESTFQEDLVRGVVFTDAKIGVSTYPDDPTLLQNRTFLYHIIGQGTGEWRVPVGGMGGLVNALEEKARSLSVEMATGCDVVHVEVNQPYHTVHYQREGRQMGVEAGYVLFNASSNIVNDCLPGAFSEEQVEGAVFKMNMVLKKLPTLRTAEISNRDAFTGTLHLNEGYEQMMASYQNSFGRGPEENLPGEIYCHSLTDPSILSEELREKGYHTLTLFGLDVPYRWFLDANEEMTDRVARNFLQSLNEWFDDDILDCLATDSNGKLCLDVKSPVDLELHLGLPKGNIFHGNLTWPFAEAAEDAGTWGVETRFDRVLVCGSSAKRGGAVSGIPGHHAAMKILGRSA